MWWPLLIGLAVNLVLGPIWFAGGVLWTIRKAAAAMGIPSAVLSQMAQKAIKDARAKARA